MSSLSGENEENSERSSTENEDNLPGKPCTCCDMLVLSKKPHKCNDPEHIGNRCVFAAFCLMNYDKEDNDWNGKCLACARRDSKVYLDCCKISLFFLLSTTVFLL